MVDLTATRLAGDDTMPLLLVGPSLGTSVEALWERCAVMLGSRVEVVGWDLPGHGRSAPATAPFGVADLARAVGDLAERLAGGRPVAYAGVSLGGAVGFQLAVDRTVPAVATLASAPRIGEPSAWHDRAALVRRAGTAVMVSGSAQRWFAPGFTDREPEVAGRLLSSLAAADDASYAFACEALAVFDLRDRMADVAGRLVVVAGEHDEVVSPAAAQESSGRDVQVVRGVAHLPPAEDPRAVADLLGPSLPGALR